MPAATSLPGSRPIPRRPKLKHWVEQYRLVDREYRVRVRAGSPLLGRSLSELDLPNRIGIRIILIERGVGSARRLLPRAGDTYLQAGDVLLIDVDSPGGDMSALGEQYGVDLLPRSGAYFLDRSQDVGVSPCS